MRSRILSGSRFALFLLLLIAPGQRALAQSSCVFIERIPQTSDFDRGNTHIVRKRTPTFQSVTSENNAVNFPNINVTYSLTADQDEPSIAINPLDSDNVIIGANDYRAKNVLYVYQSIDGGLSWSNYPLPGSQSNRQVATDPSIVFGIDGVAHFSNGRLDEGGLAIPKNEVIHYRSTNKGNNWTAPIVVFQDTGSSPQALADKYYSAIDNGQSSAYTGRTYLVWTEIANSSTRIVCVRSTDGGKTWSSPVVVTPVRSQYQSPIPACASNGDLYVTFADLDTNKHEILIARSTNGGVSFLAPVKIANYVDLGPLYPAHSINGHQTIKKLVQVNSFPSIDIDRSRAHAGRIYVTWTGMGADIRHHVFLSSSDNNGVSWSAPKAVEDDHSAHATDKFYPWVVIDPSNGDVAISYSDSRADSLNNLLSDIYLSFSNDGGATFRAKRISAASSDYLKSDLQNGDGLLFIGDYNVLSVLRGVYRPAWCDMRSGYDQDIYTAFVRPYAPSVVDSLTATEIQPTIARLDWKFVNRSTFDFPIGAYHTSITRTDGGFHRDLASGVNATDDSNVVAGKVYMYHAQIVMASGDTSVSVQVLYSPIEARRSIPPILTDAKDETDGITISFRIPDSTVIQQALLGLARINFYVDSALVDSFFVDDSQQGKIKIKTFSGIPVGYHNLQLEAVTFRDGVSTSSALSDPAYLYAGDAQTGIALDLHTGKQIFTISHWDTTTADGYFANPVLNDSVAYAHYHSHANTWFLLTPWTVSAQANTLEFDHIALVGTADSAIVEVSINDGLSFAPFTSYNIDSHPFAWGQDLVHSTMVREALAFKYLTGKNAIVRLRLITIDSGGDGWYLDSIRTTDKLGVAPIGSLASFHVDASAYPNPVRAGGESRLHFTLSRAGSISIRTYDALGKLVEETRIVGQRAVGDYDAVLWTPLVTGVYTYVLSFANASGVQSVARRVVVLP
jgi:hypothetical protein